MEKADGWILGKWQRAGFPVVVRIAKAYGGFGGVHGYGHRVIVAVELREPTSSGLPSGTEYDDLNAFEQRISLLLEADNESLAALVVTGNGLRDIFFYTKEPEKVAQKLKNARPSLTSHSFQFDIQAEPDWQTYEFFWKSLSTGSDQHQNA
jgi:hypothetical protein